jgi:hypothetical protein
VKIPFIETMKNLPKKKNFSINLFRTLEISSMLGSISSRERSRAQYK